MGRTFPATRPVRILAMRDLVLSREWWDMIHIDIQGQEYSVCRAAMKELSGRAKRVIIGTHSRKIEGDLIDLFMRYGWILEHEKPAKFAFDNSRHTLEAMTTMDGTQIWRNPRLLPQ